ncbi:MAG: hypothetical protein ACTSRG_07285 [Candidatus Helarchaeota archaeon]
MKLKDSKKSLLIIILITCISISPLFFISSSKSLNFYLNIPEDLKALQFLPSSIKSITYFNIEKMRNFISDNTIRRMYFLPEFVNLDEIKSLIIFDSWNCTAEDLPYFLLKDGRVVKDGITLEKKWPSLFTKILFELQIIIIPTELDVFGYIEKNNQKPRNNVFLFLTIDNNGMAEGYGVFKNLPNTQNYPILSAVGITFKGISNFLGRNYVHFRNYIYMHTEDSGNLTNFTRTGFCPEFFAQEGEIEGDLELSLRNVTRMRAMDAAEKGIQYINNDIILRNLSSDFPILIKNMTSGTNKRSGNIAPYGSILKVLEIYNSTNSTYNASTYKLKEWLINTQNHDLWGFHEGYIATSLDSSLVFEGLTNDTAINATQIFRTGTGGFIAQLNDSRYPYYSMDVIEENNFWMNEDFGTTAYCYYFLNSINKKNITTLNFLINNYENRSSMWIANPYYIDYITAKALFNQTGASNLIQDLINKTLINRNSDGTWGNFDKVLSTSFAILTLSELNYSGIEVDIGKLKLVQMQNQNGSWDSSDLYFSALYKGKEGSPNNLCVNGGYYDLTLYEDIDQIVTSSWAVLALNTKLDYGTSRNLPINNCPFASVTDYIKHVLQIYV